VGPSITAVGAKERSCLVKHWPETGIFVSGQHEHSVLAVVDLVLGANCPGAERLLEAATMQFRAFLRRRSLC
jgi:hypothetical protein